jgi:hypothetical protein
MRGFGQIRCIPANHDARPGDLIINFEGHMPFVDGAGGGYAFAARQLHRRRKGDLKKAMPAECAISLVEIRPIQVSGRR